MKVLQHESFQNYSIHQCRCKYQTAVVEYVSCTSFLSIVSSQPERPASVRAHAVKSELSDVEGLGFKLEERQKDILELKRSLKMKVRSN